MISLRKRSRRITRWIRGSFDYAVVVEDFEEQCRSTILKNLRQVRRGTIDQALAILKQDITRDEAIRRINEL